VSVHIISYNQAQFIAETIESALAQEYDNLEIVVSDDASTDATPEIVADYAARHPGRVIALLNRDNVGITANSNRGLTACTGEFIAFMGGDDLLLPGKIEAQLAWFAGRPERVLCGHQVELFYDDGRRPPHRFQRRLRRGTGADKLIRYGAFAACSIMVRASALPPGGFDERVPVVSDYKLWADTLARGGEFGFIPGTYARYRRHSANVSSSHLRMAADAERALALIARTYPAYSRSCWHGAARFVHYPRGLRHLEEGRRGEARCEFLKAIRHEPLFPRSWQGLLRTLMP
jgi:glycosyltransferase involved in cell wall biosynthesis